MKALRKIRPILFLLTAVMAFLLLFPDTPVFGADTGTTEGERVLFVGDSRAVDMFSSKAGSINGKKKNGIRVYARDGATFAFLQESVNQCRLKNFDTLVVWMGTNDSGNFSNYSTYYNKLLKKGKKIILCKVGPIRDDMLSDAWRPWFSNELTVKQYNTALRKWAKKKGVGVIDTYGFVRKNVKFQSDGIHYQSRSSKKIWTYILKKLSDHGVQID